MRRSWVHTEFKLTANGYIRSPMQLAGPEHLFTATQTGEVLEDTSIYVFLAAALFAVSVLLFAIGVKTHIISSPSIIGSFVLSDYESFTGEAGKESFLARISEKDRRLFETKISFVSNIIKSIGRRKGEEAEQMALDIVMASQEGDLDPLFVTALIKSESTFNRYAKSNMGAVGLMQIKPSTAKYISDLTDTEWEGASKLHDPEYNLKLGISYIKYLEKKYRGNRSLVLMAYNWGPGNMSRALKGEAQIPESTKKYARTILGNHQKWHHSLNADMRAANSVDSFSARG